MGDIKLNDALQPTLRVWCAKCNKPVDEILVQHSYLSYGYKFRAVCHGETEDCEVDQEFFVAAERLSDMEAVAFREKGLPEPQKKLGR